jgi:NAD(P)-dependent dehydrogenase (short-subunit alcohol dehydrogenase family)
MKYALITGANKSIGFETARQLLQQGYYVYLGSRSLENGQQAAAQLHTEGLTQVEPVQLDVTDAASVAAARQAISQKATGLDVLINNAGVSGALPKRRLLPTWPRSKKCTTPTCSA